MLTRAIIALLLIPCFPFNASKIASQAHKKSVKTTVVTKAAPQKNVKKKTSKKTLQKKTPVKNKVAANVIQTKKAPETPSPKSQPLEVVLPGTVAQAPAEQAQEIIVTSTIIDPNLTTSHKEAVKSEDQSLPHEIETITTTATAPLPEKKIVARTSFEEIPLPESLTQKASLNIRLLLHEYDAAQEAVYEVSSPIAVFIQDPDVSEHVYLHRHHNLKVSVKDGRLFVSTTNGLSRRLKKNHVILHPVGGHLSINGTLYSGTVSLLIDPTTQKLLFVNAINLEDYVYSVLACESGIMWDTEVHKVQAIATRSYAVYHKLQNLKSKNGKYYDLKTSNFHQVYRGHHKYNRLRPAVDATAGQVITYKDDVAIAMFDSCCGGSIPANRKRPNLSTTPHLQRKQACTFCSNFSLYKWQYDLTAEDIMANIYKHPTFQKKFTAFGKLKEIKITDKDKAGVAYKIKMVGSRKNVSMTSRELMSCLKKNLWSSSFAIKKNNDVFTIKGNGYGHQLGLCQHGARELVNRGWKYQAILQFYYPKTVLKTVDAFSGKKVIFA